MGGKRRMWRKATRAAVAAGGVAFFISLSCGEADLPRPVRWREIARFPATVIHLYGLTATPDGSVYAVGYNDDEEAVIFRYSSGKLDRVFRAPYAESGFSAVGYGGGEVWVIGSMRARGSTRGYCVRSTDGEKWEEVPVPASLSLGGPVFVRPNGVIWLRGSEGESQAIYTYEYGIWRRHDATAGADTLRLAVTERGRVYVYYYQNKNLTMMISDDGGNSWTRETVSLDNPQYKFKRPSSLKIATAGDTVYLLGHLNSKLEGFDLWGVIGREDVPPGTGRYYVAFASPHGEYFYKPSIMAFRSPSEGYVVGPLTSIVLKDGEWLKEVIIEAWSPEFRLVAAGPSSYWSIVYPSEFSQDPILYEAPFE